MTPARHAAALALLLLAGCVTSPPPPLPPRPDFPKVGGAEMYPDRTLLENAMNARDLTKLVAAVKRADIGDTLTGPGPYTLFAPTDPAFDRLPAETRDMLAMQENRARLTRLLGYHLLPVAKTSAEIAADIDAAGGTARYTTVSGDTLQIARDGAYFTITDATGGRARIAQADVPQSNGMLHVIDAVLTPGD